MYYRRCESCGAKALATATRCPRCEVAFELYDEHGKRHRLVPCRTCKVVQPAGAASCRWCGDDHARRTAVPYKTLGLAGSALAAAALLVITRGTIVPIVQSSFTSISAGAADVFASSDIGTPPALSAKDIGAESDTPVSRDVATAKVPAVSQSPSTRVMAGVPATASADAPAQDIEDAVSTDIRWEEVKATTWVNVRADRSRDASILAVLNPDDVVRLGARESGWRQVHVDGATGWVDGRHFTPSRQ